MACIPAYNSPGDFAAAAGERRKEEDRRGAMLASSSSSTSSIGRNSDESLSGGGGGSGSGGAAEGEEVQSEYKGGPLDSLEALEAALPIKTNTTNYYTLNRRGISKFYSGKSKSFTSLGDAASWSMEAIAKPDNSYNRKRKNLLAYNNTWNKNQCNSPRSNSGGIRTSKRHASSRSFLALSSAMCLSESNSSSESSNSSSSSPVLRLPPLAPQSSRSSNNESSASPQSQMFSPWRSFSLSDLQSAAAAAASTPSITGLFNPNEENLGESNCHSLHCQSPYESKFQ